MSSDLSRAAHLLAALSHLVGGTITQATDTADPTLALFCGWKLVAVQAQDISTFQGPCDLSLGLQDPPGPEYHFAFHSDHVQHLAVDLLGHAATCQLGLASGRTIDLSFAFATPRPLVGCLGLASTPGHTAGRDIAIVFDGHVLNPEGGTL